MNRNLDTILNLKRAKFLAVVKRICRARHIEEPIVNFDYCEGEDENQLAHMHPDSGQICVSERQLTKLNFDDIENTAAHEMAHFFEENHGSKFADEHMINRIASFRPGAGTTFTSENSPRNFEQPSSHSKKSDKTGCNYHLCRERLRLFMCNYCELYFCKKHLEPKPSGMPRFNDNSPEARLFREEYRREDAHPCVPYFDFREAELKRQSAAYGEALDRLAGKTHTYKPRYSEDELTQIKVSSKSSKKAEPVSLAEDSPTYAPSYESYGDYRKKQVRKRFTTLLVIIIGLAIVFLYLYYNPDVYRWTTEILGALLMRVKTIL